MLWIFWLGIVILIVIALSFIWWPVFGLVRKKPFSFQSQRWLIIVVSILTLLIPLFALFIYWKIDAGQQFVVWVQAKQQAKETEKLRAALGTPEYVIEQLRARLQKDPKSARGWYLLGRLYFSQERYPEAVDAFAKAYELQPTDPDTLFQYAQALYLTQHSLEGKPAALLRQLLKLQPQNDLATNLLAVAAFHQGAYQTAINYWEQLLPKYPPDSSDGKALLAAIAKAQLALNKQQQTKNSARDSGPQLKVSVTLNPALQRYVKPNNWVFVYARAADGSPAPLAILRKRVQDLPFTVVLDRASAMIPTLTLTEATKVVVIARISKSGQASVEPGDLQGQSKVLDMANLPSVVPIVIQDILQ